MCGHNVWALGGFLLLRAADFTGDGLMLWRLLTEFLQFPYAEVTGIEDLNSTLPYCSKNIESYKKSGTVLSFYYDLLYTLIAFGALVVISFLLTPALIKYMIPKSSDDLLDDDNDDDDSIDYDFRMTENGKKRMLRYAPSVFLIVIHDIATSALAASAVGTIVAPDGPRCFVCFEQRIDTCSAGALTGWNGWNSNLPYPYFEDLYWMAFLCGKVLGTLGSLSLVIYFELQYRYQLHVLKVQRRSQLLRRHFGQLRRRPSRNYCCTWFFALIGTFLLNLFVVGMMLAPCLLIIVVRMRPALDTLDQSRAPNLPQAIYYTTIATWCGWGIFWSVVIGTAWVSAFCRKREPYA